jgi:glycosyltransferase involved in cell wall biosynthesis
LTRVLVALNGTIGGANLSAAQLVRALPAPYEGCIVHPSELPVPDWLREATPRLAGAYLAGWHLAPDEPPLARWRWYVMRNVRSGVHGRSVAQVAALCRRWNVGLVHTNTALTLSPPLAARALGLPHVWHVRELLGEGHPHQFPLGDAFAARIFAGLSDRIVANSSATAAFFRRHDVPVTVVPNGIAPPRTDPREEGRALRSQIGFGPDHVVVGMVASLSAAWKGHRHVLEAFSRVRDPRARLVLFGEVPETPYAREIRDVAARDPRVQLAGHVPDVWAMMGAVDVLAHGAAEPFGRVFVEAMLAGKPVVTPRGGGADEIVVPGETGWTTDPDDPSDLAQRLSALISDAAMRERLGSAGRRRAMEVYTLDAHVGAMVRVYDEVLSR